MNVYSQKYFQKVLNGKNDEKSGSLHSNESSVDVDPKKYGISLYLNWKKYQKIILSDKDFWNGAYLNSLEKYGYGITEINDEIIISQKNQSNFYWNTLYMKKILFHKNVSKFQMNHETNFFIVFVEHLYINGDGRGKCKDPFGNMMFVIHRSILKQHNIQYGCVLILKNCVIRRYDMLSYYINISIPNIVQVIPSNAKLSKSLKQKLIGLPKRIAKLERKSSLIKLNNNNNINDNINANKLYNDTQINSNPSSLNNHGFIFHDD